MLALGRYEKDTEGARLGELNYCRILSVLLRNTGFVCPAGLHGQPSCYDGVS